MTAAALVRSDEPAFEPLVTQARLPHSVPSAGVSPALEQQRRLERALVLGLFDERHTRGHFGWRQLAAIPISASLSCLIAYPIVWLALH